MKTKRVFLAICCTLTISLTAIAETWPVYYQPTVAPGPPTPTPAIHSSTLNGGYCDWRSRLKYKQYHTGIDLGIDNPPGTPGPTPVTDYVVYSVVPGEIIDLERSGYDSFIDIKSGNIVYSYAHLVIDDSLAVGTPVYPYGSPGATNLGRIFHTDGPPLEPDPHLHLAVFDSSDLNIPIQNLQEHFGSSLTINTNPEVVFRKAPTPNPDPYSGITFFSDDASGSIDHLFKVVSGKVDILANVRHKAIGKRDSAGIQWIGYKIYQGLLPIAEFPKEPVHEAVLLNSLAFNGSINGRDYRPIDYDKYPTPLPTIQADVIYALDSDYSVYEDDILRDYRTADDPYGGLRFVYIVTNNTDTIPTRGNPEYISKNGCWDTTELDDDNCPKFPPGIYTVVIEARDYSGNHRTVDADSNAAVWVDSNAKSAKDAHVFYLVDDDNTSGPWDGSFEHPFQTITDALTAIPPANYVHVSPGVYESESFPIEMRNGLTLHGENSCDTIIRIPNPTGLDLIHCDGISNAIIENFQLVGGYDCITVTNNSVPLIQNNIIRNSNSPSNNGGGIRVINSSPEIFNNLIVENKIYGIYCQSSSATIMNNTISGHNFEYAFPDEYPHFNGKGIYLYMDVPDDPPLTLKNNIITNNYYGVMKCAPENNHEEGSFNNVAINLDGNYWEIWPPTPYPTGGYVRNFAYTPSPGTGEKTVNPQFTAGPFPTPICCPGPVNAFYLSKPSQSQCVDAGNEDYLPSCALYNGTTNINNLLDTSPVDMGFHYIPFYTPNPTSTPTPTGTWSTATPIPTNTPNPIAGEPSFDANQYFTESDIAHIAVFDWDRNTNPALQETLDVTITSDTDSTGITMTLTELDMNSSYFASTITGKNLGFSTLGSDDLNEIIHVTDGDSITITYEDTQPVTTAHCIAVWNLDPAPPTPSPSPAIGTIEFDAGSYFTEASEAVITVVDPELNTSIWVRETVDISVVSDTDPTGITVTLHELGTGVDTFSTSPYWTNLTFSTTSSDDSNEIIHVSDGDTITATYSDANPPGNRIATAIWVFASPTPSPTLTPTVTPTATSTPPPIPAQSVASLTVLLAIMGILIFTTLSIKAKKIKMEG